MRRAAWAVPAAALAALAACGTQSADLFVVSRSGNLPGAKAKILFDDGGQVSCNGGARKNMSSAQLIEARDLADRLADEAEDGLRLPARPGSQLRYAVRFEDGTIRFADNSRGPAAGDLQRLQALVRRVAKDVCGLPR